MQLNPVPKKMPFQGFGETVEHAIWVLGNKGTLANILREQGENNFGEQGTRKFWILLLGNKADY